MKVKLQNSAEFLDDYLIGAADAGDRVASEAARLNVLGSISGKQVDQVVIYRYGRSVLSALIKSGFAGTVLLIDDGQGVRGPWIKQESARIREVLDSRNIGTVAFNWPPFTVSWAVPKMTIRRLSS